MKKIILKISAILIVVMIGAVLIFEFHQKESASKIAQQSKKIKTITVKYKQFMTSLNFAGTLNPISHTNILSQVGGTIKNMYFSYGDVIKKNQKLIVVDSSSLLKDFNTAVTNFIKSKQAYFTNLTTYQSDLAQYKYGIKSRAEMQTSESSHSNAVLSFWQAQQQLEKIINLVGIDEDQVENMTLNSSRNINTIFKHKFDHIIIKSTGSGVALYPISSSGQSATKIQSGQAIKKDQLILSIGDLSGYKVSFEVNELQVNKIKEGMAVTVTGDAFPGIVLKGQIKSVANQANPGSTGSGMSQFGVVVDVPNVPKKATSIIRVGMSCQIHLYIQGKRMLMVPIKAVTHKVTGGSVVYVLQPDGSKKEVPVLTGLTTPQGQVAIVVGLKSGQKVVYNND